MFNFSRRVDYVNLSDDEDAESETSSPPRSPTLNSRPPLPTRSTTQHYIPSNDFRDTTLPPRSPNSVIHLTNSYGAANSFSSGLVSPPSPKHSTVGKLEPADSSAPYYPASCPVSESNFQNSSCEFISSCARGWTSPGANSLGLSMKLTSPHAGRSPLLSRPDAPASITAGDISGVSSNSIQGGALNPVSEDFDRGDKRCDAACSPMEPSALVPFGSLALVSPQRFALSGLHPRAIFSFYSAPCNIIVLGAPQVGKSSLINSYRAAVMQHERWPLARTGICGTHGTTTVEPCPNNPLQPKWVLLDTPGKIYTHLEEDESDDSLLLGRLFDGVPWRTKLVGRGCVNLQEILRTPPVVENRPLQAIVVLRATDIVQRKPQLLGLFGYRFEELEVQTELVVQYLATFLGRVKELLDDTPPFIVITHMDLLGGADCSPARAAIRAVLARVAPLNSIFFSSCAQPDCGAALRDNRETIVVDSDTRHELLRLHEEIFNNLAWRIVQNPPEESSNTLRIK